MSEPGSAYRLSVLEERWRSDRSPRVFLQLADELRRSGRAGRAIEVLRDGLNGHPESVSGWVALGRLLLDENEPATAIEAFDRALERDPGQVVAAKLTTEGWIRVGDAERAAASLERARLLSLPDADLEQFSAEIARLRGSAEAGSLDSPRAVAEPLLEARDPFALEPPVALPPIDLGRIGGGRRNWRRVEVETEPFAALLTSESAQREGLDHALREDGIFGALSAATAPGASPAAEADLPVDDAQRPRELEPPMSAQAPVAAAPAQEVQVAPEAAEDSSRAPQPPSTPLDVVAPAASGPVGVDQPVEPIFRTTSIGEEVERETALAATDEAAPLERGSDAGAVATATLAALYLSQGHLDEAEGEYRRVLAQRSDDAEALAGLEQIARRRSAEAPQRPATALSAPPLGLTARRVRRLRSLYDSLRSRRQEARARVS